MNKLAPIVLFTYNRLFETRQTIEALQKNYLAAESELFIFSDGAKDSVGEEKVTQVRDYLKTIDGFKKITIKEAKKNYGLANSIINGVTEAIDNNYGRVIVLEDDLITSPNFLDFMNQALEFYAGFSNVISISGYTLNLPSLKTYNADYYVGFRASSLGWGTWKNKWENIDWEISDYKEFKNDYIQQYKFFKIGSDLPGMLKKQIEGKIDSWAIRWVYHQFKFDLLTVFSAKSKVNHIGITEDATNAVGATKFNTPLDTTGKRSFEFDKSLIIDKKIMREFRGRFSIRRRSTDKFWRIIKNFKN
ncbi:glycosyltransferase family protein [Eudoraea adriatica]|uniref:glycosyltransferase n=1 Tax=Eudoraea adriatica TaxID=446681 RepID=UPI00037D88F0|nr:glycosyltransferase [Eudoraea adriatica]